MKRFMSGAIAALLLALSTVTQAQIDHPVFAQWGTATAARALLDKRGSQVSAADFGAVCDGETNTAAAIQRALDNAHTVTIPKGSGACYLGTTALTVGSNTRVLFEKGARLTVNESNPANFPVAWVVVDGADIEIDGAFLDLSANPYKSYGYPNVGAFIRLKNGAARVRITNSRTNYPMHSVYSTLTDNNLTDIEIVNNVFNSADGDILLQGKSPRNILVAGNNFPMQQRTDGFFAPGRVQIFANWNPGVPAVFDQSAYDNDYGYNIVVSNNRTYLPGLRPFRFCNLRKLTVTGNVIESKVGNFVLGANDGVSDDLYTLSFIREFAVTGNVSYGGGENFIDILSSQYGTVTGNTADMVDTVGVMFDFAEPYIASSSKPRLSGVTDRSVLINKNIIVANNVIRAQQPILIYQAQNSSITGNLLSFNKRSSDRSVNEPSPIAFYDGSPTSQEFFAESRNHYIFGLRFNGNHYPQGPTKEVTIANATDMFTSATVHEFTTGDKIEFYAGGTQTTVHFPGGLNYWQEYYAIVVGPSTFKVATTYANAIGGAAVDITSNGLTVAGERLLVGLARQTTSLNWTFAYIDPNFDVEFDEGIPLSQTALFSTFTGISGYVNIIAKHYKVEHIKDPLADYATGNAKGNQGKYIPVSPVKYSDGTNTYGVERNLTLRGYNGFIKGAKISAFSGTPADGYIRVTLW